MGKHRVLGIISGIGSMIAPALDDDLKDKTEVVGNYEWRKYYNTGTFEENFDSPLWPKWEDVPESAKEDIDIVMSHPECFTNPAVPIYTPEGWKKIIEIKVGDLVLTHKGRFRKVVKVFNETSKDIPTVIDIGTSTESTRQRTITVTENHPVLIEGRGWVAAKDVLVGDKIRKLAERCKECDGLMNAIHTQKGFCSIGCSTNYQWKTASPRERNKLVENAHKRTREKIREGDHPFLDPKIRSKAAKVLGQRAYGKTWLEERFGWMLNKSGITVEPQVGIDKYFVDFAIPELKIAIEVDGSYWHQDKTREELRQKVIEGCGWQVLRFSEDRINKDLFGCGEEIKRVMNNHEDRYELFSEEITFVKSRKLKTKTRLYNLGVEEDSSYIAKGFVVHNCGNFSILNKNPNSRTQENDIGEFIEHIAEIKPKFFLMDNLYPSLVVYPVEYYHRMLPDYDIFLEPVSNYHYGNIQKNRKRFFLVGAKKELGFTFRAGETHDHGITARDVFGDLPYREDIEDLQHVHVPEEEQAKGWNIEGRALRDLEGSDWDRVYYTWGELAERFMASPPGKGLEYLSQKTMTKKVRIGYFRFGWDQHGYVLHGGAGAGRCHTHFHPETGLPLTVRERARVQGFPDDFKFVLAKDYPKWVDTGVKQTGKAMPLEFCRFAMKQFIAFLEGENFEATGMRFWKTPDLVTEQKEEYCSDYGYSNQEAACNACWNKSKCKVLQSRLNEGLIEF